MTDETQRLGVGVGPSYKIIDIPVNPWSYIIYTLMRSFV